jgi:SAM-dependent methyltransferase
MKSNTSDILKNTFSNVVYDYDYARPKYPKDLYGKVSEFSKIRDNAVILEVGAGTGQATDLFLKDNNTFDLLEVSEEQVCFLENKYKDKANVSIKKAYFEEYETNKEYDLIYSATAFHWVKSDIGYPKAWKMLKDGGTMAIFWHMSSVSYYNTGIFKGLNSKKRKYLPNEPLGFDDEGIKQVIDERIKQVKSGGCFGEPEICEYRWVDVYDADKYAALINTYSSTQLLGDDLREQYLNEIKGYIKSHGGKVEIPQLVILYLVKK